MLTAQWGSASRGAIYLNISDKDTWWVAWMSTMASECYEYFDTLRWTCFGLSVRTTGVVSRFTAYEMASFMECKIYLFM